MMEQAAGSVENLEVSRLRTRALSAARRFKNSWVEFGAVLVQVRAHEAWKSWGFESFESYCAKELHIRRKTAEKLTASYGFLLRHEPEVAAWEGRVSEEQESPTAAQAHAVRTEAEAEAEDGRCGMEGRDSGQRRMPAFETISVLAGAEERGALSDADYDALRARIWGGESANESEAAVAREIRERFGEVRPSMSPEKRLQKCALASRRVADSLMEIVGVPNDVRSLAESLAERLSELSESASESDLERQA